MSTIRPHESQLPLSPWQALQVLVLVSSPLPGPTWWRQVCELALIHKNKNSGGLYTRESHVFNEQTWKQLLPGEVWRSWRAAEGAPSSPGSVQTRWSAVRAAAAGERWTTEASSSGSTSRIPPTPWDTSTPTVTTGGKKKKNISEKQHFWAQMLWFFPGADLLGDEAGQDVHDEASQSGIHGEGLDDGAHEQHGEGILLHELLHHHRQDLRRVHVPLPEAQVGGYSADAKQFHATNTSSHCWPIIVISHNKTDVFFLQLNWRKRLQ